MKVQKLDVLVIAAHPDDAELAASGTICKLVADGKKVGILDLTKGEMGTRGTIETRAKESDNASRILGLSVRHNINLADCFFDNNKESQAEIIKIIRLYQPDLVLINSPKDRHPDHGKGAILEKDACFFSGLAKFETFWDGKLQTPWRPNRVFNYIQDQYIEPDFVIDITDYWDQKMKSILAYETQFYNPNLDQPNTYISGKIFLEYLEARAIHFGHLIGVKYGEGFIADKKIGLKSIFDII